LAQQITTGNLSRRTQVQFLGLQCGASTARGPARPSSGAKRAAWFLPLFRRRK